MHIALLDSENISKLSTKMLESVDRIYVFSSQGRDELKISWPCDMKPIKLHIMKCHGSGKNNMDHHIMSFLGYVLASGRIKKVRIISNDKGYKNIVDFWRSHNADIEQYGTASTSPYRTELIN